MSSNSGCSLGLADVAASSVAAPEPVAGALRSAAAVSERRSGPLTLCRLGPENCSRRRLGLPRTGELSWGVSVPVAPSAGASDGAARPGPLAARSRRVAFEAVGLRANSACPSSDISMGKSPLSATSRARSSEVGVEDPRCGAESERRCGPSSSCPRCSLLLTRVPLGVGASTEGSLDSPLCDLFARPGPSLLLPEVRSVKAKAPASSCVAAGFPAAPSPALMAARVAGPANAVSRRPRSPASVMRRRLPVSVAPSEMSCLAS